MSFPNSVRPIRLLSFSTLYPNAAAPNHGVFVENRLRHLVSTGLATSCVLAPVPWFPSRNARFGAWARHAGAPARETRFGIDIVHPRFLTLPRIGMSVAPHLLYAAAVRAVPRLMAKHGPFDAIDAHYFYPDGVAAVWLGQRFRLPVVVTARGSDITQLPDFPAPRRLILQAARDADAIVTVSAGLADALRAMGADGRKITVLRNGVDLTLFRPLDRHAARAALGLTRKTLISVGALIERKGHDRIIDAMADLPGWDLLIVGEGERRDALRAQAVRVGVADRVQLVGVRPHAALAALYNAADVSVLASSREGWANVLLESMACGTPVVASPIPGNTEVVQGRAAGIVMDENSAAGIVRAVIDLAANPPARAETAAYASGFGWDETSAGQIRLFGGLIATRGGA
jgi:glycosyltransferase involved in cell wall biosynthesis